MAMDWRDEVMAEVGRGMGAEGLTFGESGVVSFEFEQRGALYLEQQEEGVLIYLIRVVSPHDSLGLLKNALKECHYTRATRFPMQVGLKGDDQVFLLIYLRNEEFARPNIESSIEVLTQQFEKIGN